MIQIKTRARFGNAELRLRRPGTAVGGENGAGDLLRLMLRRPWWIADIAVYAYAQWKTRRATRAKLAAGDADARKAKWQRHYMRGEKVEGERESDHQTKRRLKPPVDKSTTLTPGQALRRSARTADPDDDEGPR